MQWTETLHSQETLPAIMARMSESNPGQKFAQMVTGESITWSELRSASDLWAARFIALNVRKGDIVVTLVDSGLQAMATWLGLASIGAIDAAMNSEFRGRLLAYAINNCQPALIVVAQKYLHYLDEISSELDANNRFLVLDEEIDGYESALPGLIAAKSLSYDTAAVAQHQLQPSWHDIACITYTSGTTGPSKAVMLPWGQLNCINLGTFPFHDLDSSDIFYCTTTHAHFGSKSIPYLAAMAGGTVVIRPRFSLNNFWEDIGRFGVTTGMLVGTMADMLLRSPDSPRHTSLKNLFLAPLGSAYRHFSDRFGTRICTVYNSTEGGVALCSGWNPADEKTVGRLRTGYPGFEVRLVDEYDFDVPEGTPGELIVRAAVPWTMNAGYLNNPAATANAWRNGWLHTGDVLQRNPEGDYTFVDRLKDVIRRRGENISSYEVEADVLLNPNVMECAAVAVPADTAEDEILLFAVVQDSANFTPPQLCLELEKRMPRFMIPRYIEFVECLPKTPATQRIIKADLRKQGVSSRTWDRQRQSWAQKAEDQFANAHVGHADAGG